MYYVHMNMIGTVWLESSYVLHFNQLSNCCYLGWTYNLSCLLDQPIGDVQTT
jgi:hypothetical protein